jgi:hypothetical protein
VVEVRQEQWLAQRQMEPEERVVVETHLPHLDWPQQVEP